MNAIFSSSPLTKPNQIRPNPLPIENLETVFKEKIEECNDFDLMGRIEALWRLEMQKRIDMEENRKKGSSSADFDLIDNLEKLLILEVGKQTVIFKNRIRSLQRKKRELQKNTLVPALSLQLARQMIPSSKKNLELRRSDLKDKDSIKKEESFSRKRKLKNKPGFQKNKKPSYIKV